MEKRVDNPKCVKIISPENSMYATTAMTACMRAQGIDKDNNSIDPYVTEIYCDKCKERILGSYYVLDDLGGYVSADYCLTCAKQVRKALKGSHIPVGSFYKSYAKKGKKNG